MISERCESSLWKNVIQQQSIEGTGKTYYLALIWYMCYVVHKLHIPLRNTKHQCVQFKEDVHFKRPLDPLDTTKLRNERWALGNGIYSTRRRHDYSSQQLCHAQQLKEKPSSKSGTTQSRNYFSKGSRWTFFPILCSHSLGSRRRQCRWRWLE